MPGLRTFFFCLLILPCLLASAPAHGQTLSDRAPSLADGTCELPISTCGISASLDSAKPDPDCPLGYDCVCVPSCPQCKNCAAQVCVRAPERECKTACDCQAGLGCFDGQCIAGIAPVFCCESDRCPAGEQCQHRDGEHDRCEQPRDPMCELRVQRSTTAVARIVEKYDRCDADSDCVRIDTGTECRGDCGAYVNRRASNKASGLIDRVDKKYCDGFREDGCPYMTPLCQATVGKCVDHECVAVPYLPGPIPRPRPIDSVIVPGGDQILELEPRR